jgi:hypothetical protein
MLSPSLVILITSNLLLKSNMFINISVNILSMALLVWYLTKITALFFTLLCRFLGARKAAVLVSTNLTSPLRPTYFS